MGLRGQKCSELSVLSADCGLVFKHVLMRRQGVGALGSWGAGELDSQGAM